MMPDCPEGAPPTSRTDKILRDVLHGHELRLLRFAFFGGVSGIFYAMVVWLVVTKLGVMPLIANLLAYLLILPINFFMNRNYTFRSVESLPKQSFRFLVVHSLNISATSAVYIVAHLIHAPLIVGVIGALLVVPTVQFLALDRWVFRDKGLTFVTEDKENRA